MGEVSAVVRRRVVLVVVAVVVLAGAAFGVVRAVTAGAGEAPERPATVTVDRGVVSAEVATTGTVRPAQTRGLSFGVAGTVESVSVRPGGTVTAGQVLARVDDTAAAAAVDSALASLDDAEDALAKARDSAAAGTPATGCAGTDAVAAYQWPGPGVSASPSPAPTVSPTPTRTAPAAPTRSPARTATPRAPGGGAPQQGCTTTPGGGAARGGGANGGGGDAILGAQQQVNRSRLALEDARAALDGAVISAPIAGRVLAVAGGVGAQVAAGSSFVTLADVSGMQVEAAFPEADADRLAVRQSAAVTLPGRAGESFRATVVQVDPAGTDDGTMVRYGVLLSLVDPPDGLLVGQSANVRVTTGSAAGVLRVPTTAVHDVAGATGTVRRMSGGTATRVSVGVGLRGDQFTQITSGLAAGDVVVRSG